ncbi:sacsin-like [Argopecten irradians]|uniref:sacsin-like n=1 Tax=Argopecten irradians TaxID=31199 RepID=UPI00371C67CF
MQHYDPSGWHIRIGDQSTECKNVHRLLLYCMASDNFAVQIIGVPLCLTQDMTLKVFKEGSETFCSTQFSILPCSRSRFLHTILTDICDIEELQGLIFRHFDIPSFSQHLADNLSQEKFRRPRLLVDWIPENENIPNLQWIRCVWQFLVEQEKKSRDKQNADKSHTDSSRCVRTIPDVLQHVASWNLVPCVLVEKTGKLETKRRVLSSLSIFEEVLDLDSFTGVLHEALSKLGLPVLDRTVLNNPFILSLLPHDKKPAMVLNCLYLHRNETGFQNLPKSVADAILEYFVDHLKDVQLLEDWKHKLKSLPLHLTVQGEHVSVEMDHCVLVLPKHIPSEGIKEWGNSTGTLLLKQNKKLKPIYDEFKYTESSICDVYTSHILAKIEYLPTQHIQVHLNHIKDSLLQSYNNDYKPEQKTLIAALGRLCIFDTEKGGRRNASGLYSPHVRLFQIMKSDQLHFPMAPYNEQGWRSFMELIGMVKEASTELILQFSYQIETEGKREITEEVTEKSYTLLEYIWSIDKLETLGLLSRIRAIKFIVPPLISGTKHDIYPQFECGKLMAFEGAVPESYSNVIWSSCSILPEIADPFIGGFNRKKSDAVARQLQVCLKQPPLDKVIQHTQNVCDALKDQCEQHRWQKDDAYLESLMSDIYKYLWDHGAKESIVIERLRQKPLVYLPSENKFVKCGNLVIYLDDNGEIKPFLYPAPMVFGSNFALFKLLGTDERATCATYARVLEGITQEVKDVELHANERLSAQKAIDGLFSRLRNMETEICLQVQILYLPTKENKMVNSTQMIYSDNDKLYDAIGKEAGLPYFVGFKSLDLRYFDFDIEKLPDKYRPQVLTKLVKERFDATDIEVTQGHHTRLLQEFIQTPAFVEGLLRISHHDRLKLRFTKSYEEKQESSVLTGLQKIKVLQVKDLNVDYVYNGRVVGRKTGVFGHICKEENEQQGVAWNFYTKIPPEMERNDWIMKIEREFVKLLKKTTGIDCSMHRPILLKILMAMDYPETISGIMNSEEYREYRINASLLADFLPKCGTYVHEKWHHMLDNNTFTFDIGEYVAVHLTDDAMDSQEKTIYIYGRIEKLGGSDIVGELSDEFTKYEVDVGEGRFIEKHAFDMYKILRRRTTSNELVSAVEVANRMPAKTTPLQVIFKEVRKKLKAIWTLPEKERTLLFKRYLRRWHPDKNISNEEQATETFKYIKFVWDRLTNGDPVNIDDDVDPSSYSDSRPSANQEFYDNVYRQCSREKEWHRATAESRGGHHRSYNAFDTDPVPNPIEQRKWFKQAELDLCAAEHFMQSAEEVQGYNWICYMCHQAVEKSLKSIMYGKDANKVTKGHDIIQIADSLSDDSLLAAAGELQNLLGYHTHMRYPDVHAAGKIPSTSFTRLQAESALVIAKRILEEVNAKT